MTAPVWRSCPSRPARVLAFCGLFAIGTADAIAQRPPVMPREAPKASPRTRVLKTWTDTIKAREAEIARRLELSYDYDRGLAILRIYLEGTDRLLSEQEFDRGPRPSEDEMAEAVGLLLADRQIGSIMRSRNAVVEGGFLLEEPAGQPCGPRTRCLQIQLLSPDRIGLIRWSVVDLTSRQIVYPAYVPSGHEVKK